MDGGEAEGEKRKKPEEKRRKRGRRRRRGGGGGDERGTQFHLESADQVALLGNDGFLGMRVNGSMGQWACGSLLFTPALASNALSFFLSLSPLLLSPSLLYCLDSYSPFTCFPPYTLQVRDNNLLRDGCRWYRLQQFSIASGN